LPLTGADAAFDVFHFSPATLTMRHAASQTAFRRRAALFARHFREPLQRCSLSFSLSPPSAFALQRRLRAAFQLRLVIIQLQLSLSRAASSSIDIRDIDSQIIFLRRR
jgi:hypothetical protein